MSPIGDEERGACEPFEDAVLYDHEYRRRRADVHFYRTLARSRGGPILDIACGTGRLLIPLLRDGHEVVGIDRSAAMLARASRRLGLLSASRRARALLLRGDMRRLPFRRRPFRLAVAVFHSVQHLVARTDLLRFFRGVRASLAPGGWLAFDVLPPDPRWIGRDPERRWSRTKMRHPASGQRLVYTTNHRYDTSRKALHIRLYYAPVDERGRPTGQERTIKLCHRQLSPPEVQDLLRRAGFSLVARYGGFDGRRLDGKSDEHVYLARATSPSETRPAVSAISLDRRRRRR